MLAVTLLLGLAAHSVTTPSHFFGGFTQSYDHHIKKNFTGCVFWVRKPSDSTKASTRQTFETPNCQNNIMYADNHVLVQCAGPLRASHISDEEPYGFFPQDGCEVREC